MELVSRARKLCLDAHSSIHHTRKYSGSPYWVHPEAVAKTIKEFDLSDETIAAAYLHDVMEDVAPKMPQFGQQAILEACEHRVLEIVLEVTDVSKPEDGNRATRKAMDREHYAKASFEGQNVKLADLIDNTYDIAKHDPSFARTYLQEKEALLNLLSNNHKPLYDAAQKALAEAWVSLVGR